MAKFRQAYRADVTSLVSGNGAYSLANFRAGVRGRYLFAEGWIRNAFDTEYVPVAFSYPGLAPSGFIGPTSRPRPKASAAPAKAGA